MARTASCADICAMHRNTEVCSLVHPLKSREGDRCPHRGTALALRVQFRHRAAGCDQVEQSLSIHAGIAHTRWATHGEPSANNSHPVSSGPQHDFSVVHNGIITNYRELKQYLEKAGEVFTTETDTEVIPRLCHYVYKNLEGPVEFSKLVMDVLEKLQGAYALLIQSTYYPGEVVSCCKGSPLLFGLKSATGVPPCTHLRSWHAAPRRPDGKACNQIAVQCGLTGVCDQGRHTAA